MSHLSDMIDRTQGEYNMALGYWQDSTYGTMSYGPDEWQGLMRDLYQIEQKIERFVRGEESRPGKGLGCVCRGRSRRR